jgi:hypothetical protein
MGRLYQAFLDEGLYRGVVSKKTFATEFKVEGVILERNLEYLLDRGLIRMHKIEDLISITTGGIDLLDTEESSPHSEVSASLFEIERLLSAILEALRVEGKR